MGPGRVLQGRALALGDLCMVLGERISSEDWLGVAEALELQRSCPAGRLKSR